MRRTSIALMLIGIAGCATHPNLRRMAPSSDPAVVLHVVNRLSFGPRPGDLARVQQIGVGAYIDQQLHPESISDIEVTRRLEALDGLRLSSSRLAGEFYAPMTTARENYTQTQRGTARLPYLGWHLLPIAAVSLPGAKPPTILGQAAVTPAELLYQRANQSAFDALQEQKVLRAVYSERQLQEVLTDFWFNHFNVDARKIDDKPVLVEYERDVIRPRVFGRFRDLLGATAKSPAMLFYLDNWLSRANAINENYARELMELHTLGVDGGYTQDDVVNVARAFTGWTMRKPHEATGFEFNPKMHDKRQKKILGRMYPANRGVEDGEQVLDALARHPSTARFVATKLARRFVADDPPPALVDRVARTFRKTDGDLRAVMRTLLTSPEFFDRSRFGGKMKTPFEYVASALRASGAAVTNPLRLDQTIAGMGEPLYQCQPPTGYPDRGAAWLNTGALISRLNFARNLATNGAGAATLNATDRGPDLALRLGAPDFQKR